MKGGIYIGSLPNNVTPKSRSSSSINRKKASLEQKTLKEHTEVEKVDGEEDKEVVYDDLLSVVNVADNSSFATFARGNAISLYTAENLKKLRQRSIATNLPLKDPISQVEITDKEVLAWITGSDQVEFKLQSIIPFDNNILTLIANVNYLAVVDRKGNFIIYNKELAIIYNGSSLGHDSIVVSEDGLYAVTYTYSNIYNKYPPKLWYLTTQESKELKLGKSFSIKGVFITADHKLYIYFTSDKVKMWTIQEIPVGPKLLKQREFYRPMDNDSMDIYYTNDKLIYYSSIQGIISYLKRNSAGNFDKLCEDKSYAKLHPTYEIPPTAVTKDGTLFAAFNRHTDKLKIFDITGSTPRKIHTFKITIKGYYTNIIFSDNNKYLFITHANRVVVYNLEKEEVVQKIEVVESGSSPKPMNMHLAFINNHLVVSNEDKVFLFKS